MRVEKMLAEFDASGLHLQATQIEHARNVWRPSSIFVDQLMSRIEQNGLYQIGQVALTEINQV